MQRVRTGSQPGAYAAIRNLATGAFRPAGFANVACCRRHYGRDDRRILASPAANPKLMRKSRPVSAVRAANPVPDKTIRATVDVRLVSAMASPVVAAAMPSASSALAFTSVPVALC